MRCDIDGNLYMTRHGKGTVAVMTLSGDILREIDVLGFRPRIPDCRWRGLVGRTP